MALPDRPSLEYLKKLAKDRLPELRRANAGARLADAQLVVAREHGFPSWRALRAHLDAPGRAERAERVIELFAAIKRGEEATVERVLAADPGLANVRDAEGSTPLLAAVAAHRAGLIPLLLARGADPTPLCALRAHPALLGGGLGVLRLGAGAHAGGPRARSLLRGGPGRHRAHPSVLLPDGRLKPHASRAGSSRYRPDGTRLPCPPETDREIVSDALYMAARNGHAGAVRELLTRGPDLAFRAFAAATALHWAHFAGAPAVVALLLAAGADPALRDPVLGCTPEHFGICTAASWVWLSKVRQRLAENPALVRAESRRGGPLHEAAWAGSLEIVKLLVEAGSDPGKRNGDGKTTRDLARERPDQAGCVQVAEWLMESAPEPRRR